VAADSPPQRVAFATADGVELSGRYRPGRLGTKSAAVLVLDGVGPNARPDRCDALAAALNRAGSATLCLDFRGHGASRGAAPEFWAFPTNRKLVRGYAAGRTPDRIAADDFRPGYLPVLVNDVAAARAFLDGRNDVGECNTGRLVVVGFAEGAAVGAMWVATEWSRYRVTGAYPVRLAPSPEGKDVAGCVWVGPPADLDGRAVPYLNLTRRAGAKDTLLVGLVSAAGDRAAARLAGDLDDLLNRGRDRLFRATDVRVQAGRHLAEAGEVLPAVEGLVTDMLKVQDIPPWDDRDFADRRYVWAAGGRAVPAKDEGETVLRPVPIAQLLPR
jgi:pimeloyl-ACP methyl ester carboxylesterase